MELLRTENYNIPNMTRKKLTIQVDHSLTPETAEEKGFTFIEDVFNPYAAIEDILVFAQSRGYKFGRSSNIDRSKVLLGLYLAKKEEK